MAQKACRQCRTLFDGKECPACGSKEGLESFKGKVSIIQPEHSELASKLNLTKPGLFAIRLK